MGVRGRHWQPWATLSLSNERWSIPSLPSWPTVPPGMWLEFLGEISIELALSSRGEVNWLIDGPNVAIADGAVLVRTNALRSPRAPRRSVVVGNDVVCRLRAAARAALDRQAPQSAANRGPPRTRHQ
jgi:hypothetical protein